MVIGQESRLEIDAACDLALEGRLSAQKSLAEGGPVRPEPEAAEAGFVEAVGRDQRLVEIDRKRNVPRDLVGDVLHKIFANTLDGMIEIGCTASYAIAVASGQPDMNFC